MLNTQILTKREKFLSLLGALTLFFSIGYGYIQDSSDTNAAILAVQNAQEIVAQNNTIQSDLRWIQDFKRELSDIKKSAKTVDITTAEVYMSQYESCVNQLKPLVGTPDFWSGNGDCNDYKRSFDDEMNEKTRPARD